ncbi:MAG: SGNH/GDSL hydrolase family protein [Polyangiaceae bacterium]|nr:SGNH/GDSL hydrolase family protein [Myxococcales bacterium]MCB9585774.1 SGNH/GDSL hydrolase family protein [Polyangiaceae bacterium]
MIQSPIVDAQITAWKKSWAAHADLHANRFIKVGDSVTASGDTLYCVPRKASLKSLEAQQPKLFAVAEYFGATQKYGGSFGHESQAAVVGWSAWNAIDGVKNHLWREQTSMSAQIALVQFGTNDIEIGALHHYADKLFDLVEQLERAGTLPVLYTIMRRADRAKAGREVPRYNAVIRGVATALQVPLVDYHAALEPLPKHGLSGDGIHPSTYQGPAGRDPCDFSEQGLKFGYNVRNWLSLQVLERLRRVQLGKYRADQVAAWSGDGSGKAPWVAPGLPLVDFQPLQAELAPSACDDESTKGVSYRVKIERAGRYRLLGFDRGLESDVEIYDEAQPDACVGRDARKLVVDLKPGSYRVELRRTSPKPKKKPDSDQKPAPLHVGAVLVVLPDA